MNDQAQQEMINACPLSCRSTSSGPTAEIEGDEQIVGQAADVRNSATDEVGREYNNLSPCQLEIDEAHDTGVHLYHINWREGRVASAREPDLSLKDMWMNPHEASTSQLLCAVLKCATVVASAIAIVGSLTYVAYKLSGSSMSVNRPFINRGEWNYKYKKMRYDEVVVAERHEKNP